MSVKPHKLPSDAKKVYEGEIFTVWQWEQTLFNNSIATFERITRADAASVIGVLPDNTIMMVEDQQPHRPTVIGAVGGRLEKGETPEEAAKREFMEETGYEVGELNPWYENNVSSSVVFSNFFFIGRQLEKVREPSPDAGEKIKVLTYDFDKFLDLAHEPTLRNTELRIRLLEAKLDKSKKEELYNLLYG